jgi:hypothetical protein
MSENENEKEKTLLGSAERYAKEPYPTVIKGGVTFIKVPPGKIFPLPTYVHTRFPEDTNNANESEN